MNPSRAYIPSSALIRALARPAPPRCPFVRSAAAQSTRASRHTRSKHSTETNSDTQHEDSTMSPEARKKVAAEFEAAMAKLSRDTKERPVTDAEIEAGVMPTISHYEQDLDRGTPRRLVSRLETPEDWKKEKELWDMFEQSETNPDYDSTELNRRMVDRLVSDPSLAHMRGELKEIKEDLQARQSEKGLDLAEQEAEQSAEHDKSQLFARLRMAIDQELQDLIDDPDIGNAKQDVQALREMIPEVDDLSNPSFHDAREKLMAQLVGNKAFERKMAEAASHESSDEALEKSLEKYHSRIERAISAAESGHFGDLEKGGQEDDGSEELDQLLTQMRDVMRAIGDDSKLEAEMDALLSQDPSEAVDDANEQTYEREMDAEELADELKKLTMSHKGVEVVEEEAEEEQLAPELKAKVDKIMADPKLMERLMYLQKLIKEAGVDNDDITTIAHEVAPDPYELEGHRVTTLRERMQASRQDAAHVAALEILRVELPVPFNVSPALKSFNQAMEMAYVGANDDIRRILWRTYQKARTLPTFLQSLSDDAWDILYYSQAVTWTSNQNRQAHLRQLLADLQSVGKDGPPTHPSSLVRQEGGE